MGEVYKAYDSSLDRYVALKILPPELVERPDRVQRFIQEAKSASALSHPHIVAVYEIGQDTVDGRPIHYIAMELLDGTTLREEIAADGSGSPALLYRGSWTNPNSVSPDGKFLLFENKLAERTATFDVWLLSLTKGGAAPLIATEANEDDAFFSPNGKWLVWLSIRISRSCSTFGGRWTAPEPRNSSPRSALRMKSPKRTRIFPKIALAASASWN